MGISPGWGFLIGHIYFYSKCVRTHQSVGKSMSLAKLNVFYTYFPSNVINISNSGMLYFVYLVIKFLIKVRFVVVTFCVFFFFGYLFTFLSLLLHKLLIHKLLHLTSCGEQDVENIKIETVNIGFHKMQFRKLFN